ncbi:hypothetical protein [Myxococcus sp. Y35]|uniref:hypothetical protein n=1 Tax=Pseudomyxococcus flavus TaxID=3115648 RepID=UPI003CF05686
MISIRPIWSQQTEPALAASGPQARQLLAIEAAAIENLEKAYAAALHVHYEENVEAIAPLIKSANADLISGCELARSGYFKQAYTLWRTWYEQAIFAIYFIEAPMHRRAWRCFREIEFGKEPPHKLMLHQLLTEKGEKAHPFAVVYADRFKNITSALKINIKSEQRLIESATHRLTDLSQGVHGTYRPDPPDSMEQLESAIAKHAIPALQMTARIIGLFAFTCIYSHMEFDDPQLIRMRERSFEPANTNETLITPLLPPLWEWLEAIRR